MKLVTIGKLLFGSLLCAGLGSFAAFAQAPPGPLSGSAPQDGSTAAAPKPSAPAPPRTKVLAGTWRFNPDDSDDPRKKMQQLRGGHGQGGGRPSGGMGGGGWPGGGGMGGGRGGYGGRGGESSAEMQKMLVFLQPAQRLTISQREPEIDVTTDDDLTYAFFTDNRKLEKQQKDASRQEYLGKWDEYRLTAEAKDPRGNKYERSYEVLEGNQQLRETLFLKVGRNNTEIAIHYVYDLVPPKAQPQSTPQPPASR